MGTHRGFRATKKGKTSWMGWAYDPASKRYECSSGFPSRAAAEADAKVRHASFVMKLTSLVRSPTAQIVDDYLRFLETTKGRAPSHLRNVRRCLLGIQDERPGLVSVMPDPKHPRARGQVEDWLASLPLGARTKMQYLVTCKALFNWAVPRKYVSENPLTLAETVEPDEFLKPQYTIDELRKVVRADRDDYHLKAALMIYAGLRFQEALYLRWEDIDARSRMIAVRLDTGAQVKRRKERLVPLQWELEALLLTHWESSGRIFPEDGGHNPSRDFAAFLARVGVTQRDRDQHSFRHAYAGIMTATGVPSLLLAAYMGHASQATTAGYAQLASVYTHQVQSWPRGEFQLIQGAHSPFPGPVACETPPR